MKFAGSTISNIKHFFERFKIGFNKKEGIYIEVLDLQKGLKQLRQIETRTTPQIYGAEQDPKNKPRKIQNLGNSSKGVTLPEEWITTEFVLLEREHRADGTKPIIIKAMEAQ